MALQGEVIKYNLKFKFDAGTSRGVLRNKNSYFIKVYESSNPEVFGLGESGPLQGLSIDYVENLELRLLEIIHLLSSFPKPKDINQVYDFAKDIAGEAFPSIRFALETALIDLINGGKRIIFKNSFSEGESPISINGLVWMGNTGFMLDQVQEKINAGFKCLKLKIGALDFETECAILAHIRKKYTAEQIELRVDANGAFSYKDALQKLKKLSHFQIHSIEQPVAAGQIDLMAELCSKSEIPIALDEELIGVYGKNKRFLLDEINPSYIILKPTLLGGFKETDHWISLAEEMGIKWWITSALESNIGLNAICQHTAEYDNPLPQGLGTGQLYHNNIISPLEIKGGQISYNINKNWKIDLRGI